MGTILQLRNVSRKFGAFTAVDNLSLDVGEGEFLTLLGSSGSGKTTTLRLIAGLEMPSSGQVWFRGNDITATPVTDRDMRMVFQDYALFPNLSVFENVAFGLRLRRQKGRYDKSMIRNLVERHLETVRLSGQGSKMPHQLSGGQKQRVALARALITDPPVVLFDEPLGSLDANLRKIMQIEIKRIHRELGKTFIYVTHDQEEAMALSDRVAVLKDAKLLQVGTPQEIYFEPKSAAVARFIGAANVISGTVETVHGDEAVVRMENGQNIVAGLGVNGVSPGARVGVMMRGESFMLPKHDVGDEPISWLRGSVVESLFLGRKMEYAIQLAGADTAISVLDRDFRARNIQVGQDVRIGIRPRHVRLLAEHLV